MKTPSQDTDQIDAELRAAVIEQAARENRTPIELIRDALDMYLHQQQRRSA